MTQGGYEESANLTMHKLLVAPAYAGSRHGAGSREPGVWRGLSRSPRTIDIRPDNAAIPVESADITIASIGASHCPAARDVNGGDVDYAGWGAWQFGDWYGQPHRAYAVAAQAGYRWTAVPLEPWPRAGASYASGDDDGRDDRHGTFFPMLQDTRTYAQSMVYAQANLRDLFVQMLAEPHTRARLRGDLHRLDLADGCRPLVSGQRRDGP